ncbi:MAG: hypothetical protein ACI8RD_009019 [Bacillariaceae sp.]|jgi:hypothetical protein
MTVIRQFSTFLTIRKTEEKKEGKIDGVEKIDNNIK